MTLVALALPGGPDFVDALKRCWDEGDAVAPVDSKLAAGPRDRLLDALSPGAVIGADGVRHPRAGGRPTEPGDALVVPTSGTTGAPRGVVLTRAAVEASARASSERLAVDAGRDRWLACLPLNHVGGLSVVTRAVITETPLEVHPGFDPDAVTASAAAGATLVSMVATAMDRVDPALFRTVLLGGGRAPGARPDNVVTTYGLTETGSGVVYDGLPLDGVEVEVGAAGVIRIRGPMLLRAYRDGDDPTDDDGWLTTGDLGRWDGDRLVVEGRGDDLIVTGGENVWPDPVEAVLRRQPGVADAAVTGRDDPEWGQRVVAHVVPSDPASPPSLADVRAWVAEGLQPWHAPRELELRSSLPRTRSGKVRRSALP